jgi:hypothetical protein
MGLLVHEATHVWQHICESIGETKPSVEFEAYAMQSIVSNLLTAYEDTRGPITKCYSAKRAASRPTLYRTA